MKARVFFLSKKLYFLILALSFAESAGAIGSEYVSSRPTHPQNYCHGFYLRIHTALVNDNGSLPLLIGAKARSDFTQDRIHQAPLEEARGTAWNRFPNTPLARARHIRNNLRDSHHLRWDAAIELDNYNRPLIDTNGSSELQAFAHSEMNTIIVQPRNHNTPANSDVILVGLHGMGGSASHAGRMLKVIRMFTSRRQSGLRGELNTLLKENGLTISTNSGQRIPQVYAEAPDLPFSGSGPNDPEFHSLDKTADWLAIRLRELRESRKPIVLFVRSGSVHLALRLAERHSDLIDGFLIMSGNYPSPDLILQVDHIVAGRHRTDPSRPLNYQSLVALSHWEYDSAFQHRSSDPFGTRPRLIWIGGRDQQTPSSAVARWRNLIGEPNVQHIEDAGHDLMSFNRHSSNTLQRFVEAYRIIKQTIDSHSRR